LYSLAPAGSRVDVENIEEYLAITGYYVLQSLVTKNKNVTREDTLTQRMVAGVVDMRVFRQLSKSIYIYF
jgi:hypothetical protein